MKAVLEKVFTGEPLNRAEAADAMKQILEGEARPEEVAAFLGAIGARGESFHELAGFLDELRRRALTLPDTGRRLMDTCGTGGDGKGTFNISTAAALVVAASGVAVAKHGNRSVTSRCGSADVLSAMGIRVDSSPDQTARSIAQTGFGFLFAPLFHPAMVRVADLRRTLQVRTVFNVLGPLANPAPVAYQIVGVYHRRFLRPFAELLRERGVSEAMVIVAEDGLDEFSLSAPTDVAHLSQGDIRSLRVTPEDFGLPRAGLQALQGGTPEENARLIEAILLGDIQGPCLDAVLMNAAAALFVAQQAQDFREGIEKSRDAIRSGSVKKLLEALRWVPYA
jgi:anthranilate phosphoribosyltransferase